VAFALVLADLAGLLGYLLSIGFGLWVAWHHPGPDPGLLRDHVLFALVTVIAVLFGQTMTIFYFLGLGKEARKAATEISAAAGERMRELLRRQKGPVFRPATLALALAITVFVLGGATHTRTLSHWWHTAAAIAAVVVHVRASWIALVHMSDLHRWLADPGAVAAPESDLTEPPSRG